jgi:hypothetical protein
MIPELQGFAHMFRASHGLLHRSLEGLTDAQAMERPGGANPALWIAAHVVTVRCMIARALGANVEVPWGGQFPRGGKVEDVKAWPALAEVRTTWDDAHPAFMAALEGLTAEQVRAKTKLPGLSDDVLGVVALGALHDAYHIGQLGAARRRFELDRLVG